MLSAAAKGHTHRSGWRRLNHAVMDDAVYLPFQFEKVLVYRNPRMTNVTCDTALAFAIYDFVNIGVRS